MPEWVLWISLGWLLVTLLGRYAVNAGQFSTEVGKPGPGLEPTSATESSEVG